MRSHLQARRGEQVPFRYVLADTWYASSENMKFIKHKLKKDFVMGMKSNRLVALSEKEKLQGQFQNIQLLNLRKDEPITVYIKGLDFPVLLNKQVFTNKDGSEGILYLVCSDLSLDSHQIQTIYQKRWKVEEFHKSIPSNTGITKSPTRRKQTQRNHFFASIYAFVKLERLRIANKLNHFSLKSKLYLNAIKASFKELKNLESNLIL